MLTRAQLGYTTKMLHNSRVLVSLLVVVACWVQSCSAFSFRMEAYGKECLIESLQKGWKLSIMYEVVEGGFLDVDLTIVGPDNESLQQFWRKASGNYDIVARKDGDYNFCFSNEHSSVTNKVVVFYIHTDAPHSTTTTKTITTHPSEQTESGAETKKEMITARIESAMYLLASKTVELRRGQEFMNLRDDTHSRMNRRSNFYVICWAGFECATLVCITVAQVYYLKRFFEARRVI